MTVPAAADITADVARGGDRPALAIPWYVHPAAEPAAWERLRALRPEPSFVVVNVHNGPGEPTDPYYPPALERFRHPLIGYVDVDYGRRPLAATIADMRSWVARYPVRGFMFDQVPAHPDSLARCREFASAARRLDVQLLVANPGTVPTREHCELFDVTCTFEGSAADYARHQPPGWLGELPASRVWHLIHDCPPADLDRTFAAAAQRGAGHAFVTDQRLPHPWAGLPAARFAGAA